MAMSSAGSLAVDRELAPAAFAANNPIDLENRHKENYIMTNRESIPIENINPLYDSLRYSA